MPGTQSKYQGTQGYDRTVLEQTHWEPSKWNYQIDCQITMLNILKEIKDKIENFSRELDTWKKDQMETLEMKNKITAINNLAMGFTTN